MKKFFWWGEGGGLERESDFFYFESNFRNIFWGTKNPNLKNIYFSGGGRGGGVGGG